MKIKKVCEYPLCENKYYAKGYCWKHYFFFKKNGVMPTPENYEYVKKRASVKKSISKKNIKFDNKEEEKYYIGLKILEKEKEEILKEIKQTFKKIKNAEEKEGEMMKLSAKLMYKEGEIEDFKQQKKQMRL